MEIFSADSDLSLYVVFNLPNGNTYSSRVKELQELLYHHFNLEAVCVNVVKKEPETLGDVSYEYNPELVFKIAKPIIPSNSVMKEFFQKLDTVFKETEEYFPYFTQYNSERN